MKKNGLFLIATLLSGFCFTSCFKGSNVVDGTAVGVLGYSSSNTPILKSTIGPSYAPNLNSVMISKDISVGDCCIFVYSLDYDLPENSQNVIETNGYQTIALLDIEKLSRNQMITHLTDTSKTLYSEIPIVDPYESGSYVDYHLFISQIVNQPSDMQITWDMSYDANTMMPTVEHGERYYDIFIRATKRNEGEKAKGNTQHLVAYNIGRYLEEAASNEYNNNNSATKFELRFHYVTEIDKDTQALTWQNKKIEIQISSFLVKQ